REVVLPHPAQRDAERDPAPPAVRRIAGDRAADSGAQLVGGGRTQLRPALTQAEPDLPDSQSRLPSGKRVYHRDNLFATRANLVAGRSNAFVEGWASVWRRQSCRRPSRAGRIAGATQKLRHKRVCQPGKSDSLSAARPAF